MKKKRFLHTLANIHVELLMLLLLVAIGYLLLHDIAGGTLFSHDVFDQYTRQATAWLRGQAFIAGGQDYTWLELAVYQGAYYVSFPPVPTLPMLPLVLLFGTETPNNLVVALYAGLAVIGAYRACRACGMDAMQSCFWALFAVLAGNMLVISTNGGVWCQAQTLHMALLVWGIDCALRNRRAACAALLALAVGCRPFSILYLPIALYYFYWQDRRSDPQKKPSAALRRLIKPVLIMIVIGAAYMWYNWVRFDNPFEFGHRYLPEFTRTENGQFSIQYIWSNLRSVLFRPVTLLPTGALHYSMYDGFMFYVANPIFIVWGIRIVRDIRLKRMTGPMIALCAGLIVNLLCLCLHKTFGGWQFGARYTIDLIPYAFFYLLLSGKKKPYIIDQFLCGFGLLFNAYGAVTMRLFY